MRRNDGMGPTPKVLGLIVDYMKTVAGPSYLGIISLEIHWSLARTQQALDELVSSGQVRELTPEDKKRRGFPVVAALYELVNGKPII